MNFHIPYKGSFLSTELSFDHVKEYLNVIKKISISKFKALSTDIMDRGISSCCVYSSNMSFPSLPIWYLKGKKKLKYFNGIEINVHCRGLMWTHGICNTEILPFMTLDTNLELACYGWSHLALWIMFWHSGTMTVDLDTVRVLKLWAF